MDKREISVPVQTADPRWRLRLYINGASPRSLYALANLRHICEQYLHDTYQIEVIDLIDEPRMAEADQIVAIPTVVRLQPAPVRKVIGDLSDTEKTLAGLQIPADG
jgi:circadian clock protein KaiB